jgi:signal transduction histidine kinase
LTAVVADDGVGFERAQGRIVQEKSFGLLGMLERLRPFGGTFDVKSSAGRGATVTARVPLPIREA